MRPILLTGATGTLGFAFQRMCRGRGLAVLPTTRHELDITDGARVRQALAEARPWAVVNAAGTVGAEDAEREPERCRRENLDGALVLAQACAQREVPLLTFSSDQVFDGQKRSPYLEGDPPTPLGAFGRSKADAEAAVLAAWPRALVVRTSSLFGPWDRRNLVTRAMEELRRGATAVVPDDVEVSPTYLPDLVDACLDLLLDHEQGLWHLANRGQTRWSTLLLAVAQRAGLDGAAVEGCARAPVVPAYTVLSSGRGSLLPSLDDAVARYVAQRGALHA